MHETINRRADFPALARLRKEISPPVRIHPHRAHLIIYIETDATLDVIRVLHARSNWTRYLGS